VQQLGVSLQIAMAVVFVDLALQLLRTGLQVVEVSLDGAAQHPRCRLALRAGWLPATACS
jgi:hypothetical protein